jgi:hypothetical protein
MSKKIKTSLPQGSVKAVHPCQGSTGIPAGFGVCGAESSRVGVGGKRYCEVHYNSLPDFLKHIPKCVSENKIEC